MLSNAEKRSVVNIILPTTCIFAFFVLSIFLLIVPYVESKIIDQKKLQVRNLVSTVYSELSYYVQLVENGTLSLEEAQELAIEQISIQRFGPDELDYFWLTDTERSMLVNPFQRISEAPESVEQATEESAVEGAEPTPETEAPQTVVQPERTPIYDLVLEVIEQSGEGYIEYEFQRYGEEDRILPKLSYVRIFEPWDWIIGTGIYLEDIYAELANTKRSLIAMCGGIFFLSGILCVYLIWRTEVQESHRREAEQRLSESEESFRALAEGAGDSIVRFDRHHRHLYANPAVTRDTGIPASDFVGKSITDIWQSSQLTKEWEDAIDYVFYSRQTIRREYHLPNGNWVDWILAPEFGPEGDVRAVVATSRNITERKEAEEKLRNSEEDYRYIVENANSILLRMDTQGNITYLNDFALKYFGYKEEELLGNNIIGTIVPADERSSSDLETMIQQICLHPEQYAASQMENKTADGKRVWIAWSNKAILDEAGIATEIVCVGNDITLQRRLHNELRQTQKLEAVGTLAGGIAHDFNNILWAISGNIELALMHNGEDDPIPEESLRQALSAATRAKELVAQILAFSRQQDEEIRPLHITPVIKETSKLLRASIPAVIDIASEFTDENDVILGDATQVQQILMNLCTNAVHAMLPQGGKLEIVADNVMVDENEHHHLLTLKTGHYYRFTVSDTGRGIPESIADRILEPYFTTKEIGEGTGLGLSVVHGIIERFKGYLYFESEKDHGTVFTVLLPLVKEEIKEEESTLTPETGTEHILLVDDQEEVRNMLARLLEKFGYHVTTSASGLDALLIFDSNPEKFDLVITDRTMPGMTGEHLAKELFARRSSLPVILCTGYSDLAEDSNTTQEGICEVLSKPISAKLLSQAIRRHLNTKPAPLS